MEAHIRVIDSWLKPLLPVMTGIALTRHGFSHAKTVTTLSPLFSISLPQRTGTKHALFSSRLLKKYFSQAVQRLKGEGLFSHNKIIRYL
jgi:hypothetical protein